MLVDHTVEGPDDAPVLVLASSIGSTRAMWDAQAGALSDVLRVVRYDHRGHGGSPVPPGPYAMADLGGDVVALLDHLGVERASFCGLSMGGMVGMWLGEHAAGRLDRLVLCCTTARMAPELMRQRAAEVRAAGTTEPLADGTMERWFTPAFRASDPDEVARIRAIFVTQDAEGYASCAEAIAGLDVDDRLGEIAAPTLVIAGADDPSTPPQEGERIAAAVRDGRFEAVEARHLANVERPDEVTALIRAHVLG